MFFEKGIALHIKNVIANVNIFTHAGKEGIKVTVKGHPDYIKRINTEQLVGNGGEVLMIDQRYPYCPPWLSLNEFITYSIRGLIESSKEQLGCQFINPLERPLVTRKRCVLLV